MSEIVYKTEGRLILESATSNPNVVVHWIKDEQKATLMSGNAVVYLDKSQLEQLAKQAFNIGYDLQPRVTED